MKRLTSDIGFADSSMVASMMRRLNTQLALKSARASTRALLDLLNKQRQSMPGEGASLAEQGVRLASCDSERGTGRITIEMGESDAVREQQLLAGIDLVFELLDQVEVGIRHGLFSAIDELDRKLAAHRRPPSMSQRQIDTRGDAQ